MDETMRKKHIKIAEQTVNDLAMIVRNAIDRIIELEKQREWVGLTDEEINDHWRNAMWNTEGTRLPIPEFARAIEAKLKEKNR